VSPAAYHPLDVGRLGPPAAGSASASGRAADVRRPLRIPAPPGIEVDEHTEESEGFSEYLSRGYGMDDWTGLGFFIGLPVQRYWRTYVAVDAERQVGIGAAATKLHYDAAQLGLASTPERERGRGVHAALIRRRLEDALAAGARRIFAVAEEPLGPEADSPAARNLIRAGFAPAATRTVWKPPEELLAEDDEDDEDDEEWEEEDDEDEWDGNEDDLDDDHDFELGG
jgi:hypothetical protein